MKKLLIALVITMSLVGTVSAADHIYILGNRTVYMTASAESAGQDPVIVDCQKENNSDQIGCIIASNMEKEKQLAKKSNKIKQLHASK